MPRPTRVHVLAAPGDRGLATRLVQFLQAQDGLRPEPFDLKAARTQADPAAAWYVVLLAPELARQQPALDWVMEAHPDRVLPVLARDCDPEAVHPRLAFLAPHDLRAGSDEALESLAREWQRQGVGRVKADRSILLFLSLKGGVAKTTNAVAVAEYLAEQGNRVLVVDTDHQCGASAMLLGEERLDELETRGRTLADLFGEALDRDFDPDRIARYAVPSRSIRGLGERLHVVPGSLRLEDFWTYFRPTESRDARTAKEAYDFLREKRRDVFSRWLKRNYDYVIVDCPPAIAWQVRFFLLVADGYVVPAIPDRLSVRGARYLSRRLHKIGVTTTRPVGLLWSMRREIQTHSEYVNTIRTGRERLGFEPGDAPVLPRPFQTVIPHTVSIIRGQTGTEPFKSFRDKYEAGPARVFADLCREILERTRGKGSPAPDELVLAGS